MLQKIDFSQLLSVISSYPMKRFSQNIADLCEISNAYLSYPAVQRGNTHRAPVENREVDADERILDERDDKRLDGKVRPLAALPNLAISECKYFLDDPLLSIQ